MIRPAIAALVAAWMALAGPARAEPPVWTLDMQASAVGFTARQMQVTIPGSFSRFSAAIRFAPDELAASSVEVVVDVASIETPNEDVEAAFRSGDWFDIAHFPEARFVSEAFEHRGGDRYDVTGALTLRDLTLPVTLPLTITIADDPDDPDLLVARATAEVPLSRLAFGVGQRQWSDAKVVSDEVAVTIDIVARRAKP